MYGYVGNIQNTSKAGILNIYLHYKQTVNLVQTDCVDKNKVTYRNAKPAKEILGFIAMKEMINVL